MKVSAYVVAFGISTFATATLGVLPNITWVDFLTVICNTAITVCAVIITPYSKEDKKEEDDAARHLLR